MTLAIGLVYDLRREYLAEGYGDEEVAEFDSDATIDALEAALRQLGYSTDRIGHARALCSRLVRGDRWDLVFTLAEGLTGRSREGQVPSLLELYRIPCTFSDPLTCAVTLDKAVTKRLIRDAGLPTTPFHVVHEPDDLKTLPPLRYPLFAKPNAEGTGKGIDGGSRLETPDQLKVRCQDLLRRYEQPVLVEEYLPGREFTVGILGTGTAARAIGTMQVALRPEVGHDIYAYDTKEQCERLVHYSRLEPCPLREELHAIALRAYRVLECRDAARVDLRLDRDERPMFLELNPLAGLHPSHSDLPMIATQEGMRYVDLIGAIVESALRRRKA